MFIWLRRRLLLLKVLTLRFWGVLWSVCCKSGVCYESESYLKCLCSMLLCSCEFKFFGKLGIQETFKNSSQMLNRVSLSKKHITYLASCNFITSGNHVSVKKITFVCLWLANLGCWMVTVHSKYKFNKFFEVLKGHSITHHNFYFTEEKRVEGLHGTMIYWLKIQGRSKFGSNFNPSEIDQMSTSYFQGPLFNIWNLSLKRYHKVFSWNIEMIFKTICWDPLLICFWTYA